MLDVKRDFDRPKRGGRCRAHSLVIEEGDRWDTAKLRAAVQLGDLEDEQISDQVASQLLDEIAGSSSGTTWKKSMLASSATARKNGTRREGFFFFFFFARRVAGDDWRIPSQGLCVNGAAWDYFTHQ